MNYKFQPNIYRININQLTGLLQACNITFTEEQVKGFPADLAQHFVPVEMPAQPVQEEEQDEPEEDAIEDAVEEE